MSLSKRILAALHESWTLASWIQAQDKKTEDSLKAWMKTQWGMGDGWDCDAVVEEGHCRVPGAGCRREERASLEQRAPEYTALSH